MEGRTLTILNNFGTNVLATVPKAADNDQNINRGCASGSLLFDSSQT